MKEIFGLPLHPLAVHFPAVAIPVLAILAIWFVLRPSARRRFGIPVVVLAFVTIVATFVAASSGGALADGANYPVDDISKHKSLGETLRFMVLGLGLGVAALVFGGRTRDQQRNLPATDNSFKDPLMMGLGALTVVLAILSGIWTVRTGHEGAKSAWEGVFPEEAGSTVPVVAADTDASPTQAPEPTAVPTAEPTEAPAEDPGYGEDPTEPPEEPAPTEAAAEPAGVDFSDPALITAGEPIYTASCVRCHGADGLGTSRGPTLAGISQVLPDVALHLAIVTEGEGRMPGFGASLSEDEINAVVAYTRATF